MVVQAWIPAHLQGLFLKRLFPDSRLKCRKGVLEWQADFTPSSLSRTYTVSLRYSLNDAPKVRIVNPKLAAPQGVKLPHTYLKERLCLYFPKANDWHPSLKLADTVVPWISEWLYYYEIWLVTGKWHGGGRHPDLN